MLNFQQVDQNISTHQFKNRNDSSKNTIAFDEATSVDYKIDYKPLFFAFLPPRPPNISFHQDFGSAGNK